MKGNLMMQTNVEKLGLDDEAIYYPEYDSAIVGTDSKGRVVYDIDKCIEVLVSSQDMNYEDAVEYFWFNTEGAYFGDMTPVFINQKVESEEKSWKHS
ncbi:MAG: hypothetical protein EBY39_02800 [Flavobacteriia bacterium]|nr:hypothetical protein [Flavobacteriia bacterium]